MSSASTIWKALIVDDEPRSRAIARRMLAPHSNFEVVAECPNGYEALTAVSKFRPHLMLLDIQMPEMDGFAVVDKITADRMPIVVFLTAFDHYAVRAFNVHALDYLLKPFDEERFATMISRVEELLKKGAQSEYTQQVLMMMQAIRASSSYAKRFLVRLRDKIIPIPVEEVDWIEAEDNYIRIHRGSASYLEREPLTRVTDRLDPTTFVRVHRSALVNVGRIKEMIVINGEYELILLSGVRLALSRTYRDVFFERLGNRKQNQ